MNYKTSHTVKMDKGQVKKLIRAHLEEGEAECRWCFAVDMYGVKANIIGQYNFQMQLH